MSAISVDWAGGIAYVCAWKDGEGRHRWPVSSKQTNHGRALFVCNVHRSRNCNCNQRTTPVESLRPNVAHRRWDCDPCQREAIAECTGFDGCDGGWNRYKHQSIAAGESLRPNAGYRRWYRHTCDACCVPDTPQHPRCPYNGCGSSWDAEVAGGSCAGTVKCCCHYTTVV